MVNDRISYAKESQPSLMLWWGGGRWWIGKRDELGQNRGWIKAEGGGAVPPLKGWVVYSSRSKPGMWKAATEVSCAPAERLELGGLPEGTPHAEKLGPVSAHTLPVGLPPPIGRSRQNRVRGAVAPGTSMKPLEGLKIDVNRGSGAPHAPPQT